MDFSGVALLLIGTAVVAIILGHEMACLASDADIDEILASKRPYLTCVLYFICTLINCALKSVWYICKVPWLITQPSRKRQKAHLCKCQAQPSRKRQKAHLHGQTRPMLNVEILLPSQNHDNVILPVCLLLVMNPAIFTFCWQYPWEPLVCACVLERVMFVLGLLCLGWTLMAAKVFDFGMNCGALLSRFSLRRMSRRTSGRNGTASIAPASTEMAPQVLRQRQDFTNLEQARANETKRWRMLQEPWFLRRCQRAERRAATRRQSLNTFLRRSLI
jgi:hypothetical protein